MIEIEYACEKCGEPLMKTAIVPVNSSSYVERADKCDNCNHVTNVLQMARLQWSDRLRSDVNRLCNSEELKQLRLDPNNFVNTILNARRSAAGKGLVVIDKSTTPITLREETNRE